MNIKTIAIILVLLLSPYTSVMAKNFGYNYFGFDFGSINYNDTISYNGYDFDTFGTFNLYGSLTRDDHIAFLFSINGEGADSPNGNTTLSTAAVNFDIKIINSFYATDLNFAFGLISLTEEACINNFCASADDSGYKLQFEVRHALNLATELFVDLMRQDLDYLGKNSTMTFGTAFNFTPNSSLRLSIAKSKYQDVSTSFGYRYSY